MKRRWMAMMLAGAFMLVAAAPAAAQSERGDDRSDDEAVVRDARDDHEGDSDRDEGEPVVVDEPVRDEPVTDEPKADEPKTDEPRTDEPKDEPEPDRDGAVEPVRDRECDVVSDRVTDCPERRCDVVADTVTDCRDDDRPHIRAIWKRCYNWVVHHSDIRPPDSLREWWRLCHRLWAAHNEPL